MREDTKRQVDFLIDKLELKGNERILDLACGFGRHSLEFARRGYEVTGVDITPEYIRYATEQAGKEKLNAEFICRDIRDISFENEFDVVLNMADGAIGYLENGLTLSAFEWNRESRTMLYGQIDHPYGEVLSKPEMYEGNTIRLYTLDEITEIFSGLGLRVGDSYADFSGRSSSENEIQLMVCSVKK